MPHFCFQDGKQIIADTRILTLVENDQYSLLITEALPQDTGTYECIARNPKGESRCISHVAVACKSVFCLHSYFCILL